MILFTFLFVIEKYVCKPKKTPPHRTHVKVAPWFVAKAVTCKALVVFSITTFLWQTLVGCLTQPAFNPFLPNP